PRVPESRVNTSWVLLSWLHLLKSWSLQDFRGGSFSVSTSKPVEAQQADTSEHHPVNDHDMSTINAALAEIEQGSVDGLAALGVGVAVGRLDSAALVQKFSQISGHDTEQSHARLVSIKAAYQSQADSAITSRYGIAPADLPAFYQWARASHQGKLQEAVHKQIHTHDVSGYRAMAAQWLAETPPSAATLKAAGLPVRMQDESQQVFVQGQWMRSSAAARAGLI
ncbi:MAG: hypothetical protein ABL916_17195, partial [Burkholderiaceae bacterium]